MAADDTLAAKFAEKRDSQPPEWEERRKKKAEEILAIHETIKLLNTDDALDLFKASLTSPSLVQVPQSTVAVATRAMDGLCRSSQMRSNAASNLKLISGALNGKSVDLSKVMSVIDETVTLFKEQQGEDDGRKAYYTKSFGQTEDEGIFPIKRGTKQEDPLSSLLFNTVLQYSLEEDLKRWQEKQRGIRLSDKKEDCLTNLRFADDELLFSTSLEKLRDMLCEFKTSTEAVGLGIHPDKTKILSNQGKEKTKQITVDKINIEVLS